VPEGGALYLSFCSFTTHRPFPSQSHAEHEQTIPVYVGFQYTLITKPCAAYTMYHGRRVPDATHLLARLVSLTATLVEMVSANSRLQAVESRSQAILIVTGVMAAGKSTAAQLLADRLPKAVHLRGDIFRRMIVTGRHKRWAPMRHQRL
jgi:type II secretory pathway predicted ATPase ExeA